jgi:ferredoxin-NADP reductase
LVEIIHDYFEVFVKEFLKMDIVMCGPYTLIETVHLALFEGDIPLHKHQFEVFPPKLIMLHGLN